jgi:uncharacterized protein (TIGR00251 family)
MEKKRRGQSAAVLSIRVTPRAKRNEIAGVMEDGTVKVRLTAPPVEGKANEALLQFLAEVLDVSHTRLAILAGATGRNKRVQVEEMDLETARLRILGWGNRKEGHLNRYAQRRREGH